MPKPRVRKISKNITEGSLRASIWKLALPLMIGALLQDLFTLVDLFFVGKLGYVAVAALAISGVIVSVIAMFTMGISAGTTALISHFVGKKEYGSADNVLFQTIVVSAISSFVIALIGLFGRDALLRLFGATPEILPLASAYLKITFAWSIFFFLFIGFNQALRGSGDAVTPLRVLIIANAINIVLDPLFIFGFGILPGWGVAGSAVATVISQGIGVMILLRHLIFGHSTLHLHRGIFKVNFLLIGRMVKIGFFASLEVLRALPRSESAYACGWPS
jgi:putative MATE family efflux protein